MYYKSFTSDGHRWMWFPSQTKNGWFNSIVRILGIRATCMFCFGTGLLCCHILSPVIFSILKVSVISVLHRLVKCVYLWTVVSVICCGFVHSLVIVRLTAWYMIKILFGWILECVYAVKLSFVNKNECFILNGMCWMVGIRFYCDKLFS